MLPEVVCVPLAVLPVVPDTAGPGFALAIVFSDVDWFVAEAELDGVSAVTGGTVWLVAGLVVPTGVLPGWVSLLGVDGDTPAAAPVVPAVPIALWELSPVAAPVFAALGPLEPVLLHVSAMCWTLLTLSVLDPLWAPAGELDDPLVEADAELLLGVPVIATSCPTCWLSCELSPVNCHAFPD